MWHANKQSTHVYGDTTSCFHICKSITNKISQHMGVQLLDVSGSMFG